MELSVGRQTPRLERMEIENQNAEIWRAQIEEADAAFCLVREYFETVGVVLCEDREKFIQEYFGAAQGFWLARVGGELAGCVGLRRLQLETMPGREDAASAEIKRMYVRAKFRGRRLAQRLLEAAECFARLNAYAWIYLDTMAKMKAAARLYERNGFELCERYNENTQAAIFMRKNLDDTSNL